MRLLALDRYNHKKYKRDNRSKIMANRKQPNNNEWIREENLQETLCAPIPVDWVLKRYPSRGCCDRQLVAPSYGETLPSHLQGKKGTKMQNHKYFFYLTQDSDTLGWLLAGITLQSTPSACCLVGIEEEGERKEKNLRSNAFLCPHRCDSISKKWK